MQILIPFAVPSHPACQNAFKTLDLPHLRQLLPRLTLQTTHESNSENLTPLHEHLTYTLQGLTMPDGLTGAAAQAAQQQGLFDTHNPESKQGWAFITLCHWEIHAHDVHMADPQQLMLSEAESNTLLSTMQPYFADDGVSLYPHQPGTWLAHGSVFYQLPTASLYRVSNQSVNQWIPRQAQAKALRRLQNEMQMLLYTHPVNDARAQRGVRVVNSFWVSGTGNAITQRPDTLEIATALTGPACEDNAQSWCQGWKTIDETLISQALQVQAQGQNLQLTLCAEDRAITFTHASLSWWKSLARRMHNPPIIQLLQPLLAP